MIVVIQCAATKKPNAGHLCRRDGKKVLFVANPDSTPNSTAHVYARPDDIADTGISWREELFRCNARSGNNQPGLLPAWQLYKNLTYECLYKKYGPERLYILSAGWGLIRANFLTPNYDITFSRSADKYKRRIAKDRYNDFCMLPTDTAEPVVFFGGKDYLPLFYSLTQGVRGRRHIFYVGKKPDAPLDCILKSFGKSYTNWHYGCAKAFIEGNICI